MILARVIGAVWATRKAEKLRSFKLLVVQPLHFLDGAVSGLPLVAADRIGAGVGETVLVACGSAARRAVEDLDVPVDATVVGIVDGRENAMDGKEEIRNGF